jgi:hypothetical protein
MPMAAGPFVVPGKGRSWLPGSEVNSQLRSDMLGWKGLVAPCCARFAASSAAARIAQDRCAVATTSLINFVRSPQYLAKRMKKQVKNMFTVLR